MQKPFLEVVGLNKSYAHPVLEDLNFKIQAGELWGLLGINGAGKSTLLKSILELQNPDSGEIRKSVQIGYAPDSFNCRHEYTVREYLESQSCIRGGRWSLESQSSAGQLVKILHLSSQLDRPVRILSKGNLQKLNLVQSLIGTPELLIWDEPFSGLDPQIKQEAIVFLKDYVANQRSVIFSSHQLRDVESLCPQAMILHKAKLKIVRSENAQVTSDATQSQNKKGINDLEKVFFEELTK